MSKLTGLRQRLLAGFTSRAWRVEMRIDRARFRLRQRLNLVRPVRIAPYRGHGNGREVFLRGRVIEDRKVRRALESDSRWQNLTAAYKRIFSGKVPGARVAAQFAGGHQQVTTDEEGYFECAFTCPEPLSGEALWHAMNLRLLDAVVPGQGPVEARGEVLVPGPRCQFGVISDIDDTIVRTNATQLLRMIRLTLFNNAHTRVPFEGVAAFYRALQQGRGGHGENPIFYLSSSPWNFYDLLEHFMEVHDLPDGPIILRDFGLEEDRLFKSSHRAHKVTEIKNLMHLYERLPFILIGDSGQHDPEIYREVVEQFPGRVLAIYIREVTASAPRRAALEALAADVGRAGVEMLRVPDTAAAARHAVARGYIDADALQAVRARARKDTQAPTELEQLVGGD